MSKIGQPVTNLNKAKKKEEPKVTYSNERPQSAKGKTQAALSMMAGQ